MTTHSLSCMKFKSTTFVSVILFLISFSLFLNPVLAQESEPTSSFSKILTSIETDLEILKNQHLNSNNNENLNIVFAIVTGIAIPIGLLIYQPIRAKRTLVNQNSESLIKEIQSNEDALTGKQEYDVIDYKGFDPENSPIRYTNAFLDYNSYENLINSGQFSYFTPDTQASLREMYTRIKDHDRTIKYIDELEDKFKIEFPNDEQKFLEAVAKYEVVLTIWESQILELIPSTKTKLEKEKKKVI